MTEFSVKEVADLALDGAPKVIFIESASFKIPMVSRPSGDGAFEIESVKAEIDKWRDAPERRRGTAVVGTIASFVDLVNRHKDANSAIFADLSDDKPCLTAVIDYHKLDGGARFGAHRIQYGFPISPEWAAWRAGNGRSMPQGEWASFIEEHIADLVAPLAAEKSQFETLFQTKIALPSELISLSRNMQISVEARIKDVRVIQTGESEIVYEEVHKDGSGQKLIVPGLFIINIPLFRDGHPVRITVRLRYRRNDGKISWFYQLYRASEAVRARLQDDCDAVVKDTALPLYEGKPEV